MIALHLSEQYLDEELVGCECLPASGACFGVDGRHGSCWFLVCCPDDGVASADSEGGYYVVAAPVDVAFAGGFVVSFLCKNKLASFLFLFLL